MKTDTFINNVDVYMPAAALDTIFDECDHYDADETGGRLVGTYTINWRKRIKIHVTGVIEPGPRARRTATSFFQDGDHQANVFREIEAKHPDIEHLGNWHTHHVNGYPTLSDGDRNTYQRIVNHNQHNLDFFYAILVVSRGNSGNGSNRYNVRHFILWKDDPNVYEIPPKAIKIIDAPLWWPSKVNLEQVTQKQNVYIKQSVSQVPDRGIDQQFLKEFYPKLHTFFSQRTNSVYWKGAIELIDGTDIATVIAEMKDNENVDYAVHLRDARNELVESIKDLEKRRFNSCRSAAFTIQTELNRQLFQILSENQ